mmetsp:Transcript_97752/g.226662  ORF Transcript_97752/g.226662 Transcript_97752/m.226662 type:complete len:533 (-) Transcript_97752:110-1708(-)|eukprot:CAMPEP_0171095458 /NCGR_PEP_ID=MMETSP0766_2-20121228/43180_1 /TAXON_ID=439317 /ORGANISM="Gambierdiscus australes, Strain CAWD 149" /LENGTH=532 /DNA_ID=CAMNT_0011554267 /DNA_START=69 /DNA_END=1667 /DNA_ORIENTATION=-
MPEYHPGTEIEIPDAVPTSGFRCAINNPKRYMKHNGKTLEDVCDAAYKGDYDKLEELLSTGDETTLFNGDLNAHQSNITALHMASMMGQTECVELLLKAKADPHVKECVVYGQDPEDGKTALDYAKDYQWDDCVEVLEQAEKETPYGWYVTSGLTNNAKVYGCWTFGKKPAKGFFSSRPGAAEICGFDPMKYGTGPLPEAEEEEEPELVVAKSAVLPTEPPVPCGLLFPGQGSQYVKMMSTVKDIPKVQEYLATAKTILGYDVLELCLQGPEDKLERTSYCQPAMFIAGMAGLEKLRVDKPDHANRFQVTAGLSLGEYTALCAAGVFSFEDGLKLVKMRGAAMEEAAQAGKQAMLSVAGLEKPKLEALCKDAQKKEGGSAVCQIANELFPKGFSCAGTESSIIALKDMAEKAGALQAKILKTSGAFHTSLMAPAKEKLGAALDEMLPQMNPPRHTVYMNANAQPLKPGTPPREVVELLKKQLTTPVLWEPSVRAMIKAGVNDFYEVGPMKQIKAMMKRIDSKVWGTTTNIEV